MTYSPLQLAEAFIQTGELTDALDALNTHLSGHPADDAARRLRAAVLMRLPTSENTRTALADLDQISAVTAADAVQRSIILQRGGDWEGAQAAMQEAHRLRPDDERICERYVETLARCGQVDQALELVAAQPINWRWLQIAGDLKRDTGDAQAAAQDYTAAIAHLDAQMDTAGNAVAANLKAILVMKLEAARG